MRFWPRPSLSRRVIATLLAAFLLVWGVLSAKEYLAIKDDVGKRESLGRAAQALVDSIGGDDPVRAAWVLAAADRTFNRLRKQSALPAPGDILLVLERRDGAPVYASPGLAGRRLPPAGGGVFIDGREYWSVSRDSGPWRLRLLEPALGDRHLLALIGTDLMAYLFIALPLVLLPIWFAVRRGLEPLRAFAAAVAARAPDDFTPLAQPARYAELDPLVAAFNALLVKVRRNVERERAFVQDAAHELRTPLAVIAGQAHLLGQADDPAERNTRRQDLEQAVARASARVSQLLALASLDGTAKRVEQEVDLVQLTRAALIAVSSAAGAKAIEIALDSPDRLPIRLDVTAFHSILENLLGNAIAHCPEGARVQVELAARSGRIHLTVADDGPGIAEADRPRLFERFYRGRSTTTPGSGLGLAIARRAVATLGGGIDLLPGLDGRGVAFEVSWPAA